MNYVVESRDNKEEKSGEDKLVVFLKIMGLWNGVMKWARVKKFEDTYLECVEMIEWNDAKKIGGLDFKVFTEEIYLLAAKYAR